ncbi:MAG: TraB/GumN family protein [Pseudomonadota bacterium]|nr:TraB/GumN family protein [Pseudomonadota bacterium]
MNVTGTYGDYEDRSEALAESFSPELEQACFEQQVRLMEDMDDTKRLANSWAQGDVSGFRNSESYNFSLVFGQLPACEEMNWGSSSPLQQSMARISASLNQAWLDAAANALSTNASTLAILPINELLADDGLLRKLKAMGYEVEP